MYEINIADNKSVELYHVLKFCKEGNCINCERDPKGSDNRWCKEQLLQECFDWFDQYLGEE